MGYLLWRPRKRFGDNDAFSGAGVIYAQPGEVLGEHGGVLR
jgi:hypothetical protein